MVVINPLTSDMKCGQKNGALKSIEDVREVGASISIARPVFRDGAEGLSAI